MQGPNCPNCGAPVPAGAQFCAFCGASLSGAAPPLTSAPGSPSYPPPPTMPYAAAPPPRPRRTRVVIAVVLVVVILIVAVIAVAYFLFPAPPVQVSAINIWAPDNVCGLNSNPIYYSGLNFTSTGSSQVVDLGMPNFNSSSCTIVGATTNTSGFTISDAQIPLTIGANGTASMNVTVTAPTSDYSGNLNLVLS
jgi:zinc-ribbon domain